MGYVHPGHEQGSSLRAVSDQVATERLLVRWFNGLGGLMSADDMVLAVRDHREQALSHVAREIVERRILTFTFGSTILAPRFQFEDALLTVLPSVVAAVHELDFAFELPAVAGWFAEPNCWIHQQRPCTVAARSPQRVIDAARTDRRVATGW